jgi:hypothetical protein
MPWPTPLERFIENTELDQGGCWIWTGGRKKAGYGQFSVNGRKVIAHRWSYQHFVGPIPDEYEVDHVVCNRPPCVNPAHLEAVTLQVNRERRNARKTHCVNGHEYTPANTGWQVDSDGYRNRYCKTCNRIRHGVSADLPLPA